ncbi:MAG: aldo/keto reductase [Chthonomonadales bacterium]|nr:aldo/keto reductase [Chthonomonadales bacterium]
MDRREFLTTAAAAGLATALGSQLAQGEPRPLPRRRLGKTPERISVLGLGGIVVMGGTQEEASRVVRDAVNRGVNYFDVAPSYGDGEAEQKLGPALEGYRDRVFLACKTARRDRGGAAEELQTSLERLRTNRLDLYQLHGLTSVDEVRTALGPDGAIEALREARERGQVRYLGFSAHSVDAAMAAMDGFAFDTILFPVNWVCWYKGDFGPQVLREARSRDMGCLALKAMARSPWAPGEQHGYPKCWYRPEDDPARAALALRFTLSQPVVAALPPGDSRLFELALTVAERYKPITAEERGRLKMSARDLEPIFRRASA